MEKEFVTYEQAVALKELGFDEPCLAHFTKYSKNGTPHLVVWEDYSKHQDVNKMSRYGECLAPLKQQAFRWFREKYNLNVELYIANIRCVEYSFNIVDLYSKKYIHGGSYSGRFNTYEEAESDCIDKLIELAKRHES